MSIEVEHKFKVTAHTRPRLLELGAELQQRCSFTDCYYDGPAHVLMLQCWWLRRRGEDWQLKVVERGHSTAVICREVAEEGKILELLQGAACFPAAAVLEGGGLQALVEAGVLQLVAEFTTERESYVFGHRHPQHAGLQVDLDETDMGHSVGEVELMVGGMEECAAAELRVNALAAELGPVSPVPGPKLSAYLCLHQPLLWQQLVDKEAIRRCVCVCVAGVCV